MLTFLFDALSLLVDFLHLLIIVFGLFGGALPRYKFPKTYYVHKAACLIVSLGIVFLNGHCWLTDVSHWLREKAHPEVEQTQTFAAEWSGRVGLNVEYVLIASLVLLLTTCFIGGYFDARHRRRKREERRRRRREHIP